MPSGNVFVSTSFPGSQRNSRTVPSAPPEAKRRLPSGCQARPSQASGIGVLSGTERESNSTIVSVGFATPLFVQIPPPPSREPKHPQRQAPPHDIPPRRRDAPTVGQQGHALTEGAGPL